MNFRKTMHLPKLELQLIPMIDVIFFLLTFFILTWNLARWETQMNITVPTATESTETRRQPGEIVVNIDKGGQVLVNQKVFDQPALLTLLKSIGRQFPDQSIIIRADRGVEYRYVIQVLDVCRMADIWNVGFATRRDEETRTP